MRMLAGLLLGVSLLGAVIWAYQENYSTRQAKTEKRALEREIGELREHLDVLQAEWAYLNRPERLRELTELNFERLRLLPMTPEHFGRLDQVAYPPISRVEPDLLMQTDVSAPVFVVEGENQ